MQRNTRQCRATRTRFDNGLVALRSVNRENWSTRVSHVFDYLAERAGFEPALGY